MIARSVGADSGSKSDVAAQRRVWSLPACYDPELAPDLLAVAAQAELSLDALIDLHAGRAYYVYMLGFLPGQPYLGNIDERIRLPRLKGPKQVAAGSIGIAMSMTSIWPMHTPCGWNIIASTPCAFGQEDAPVRAPGDLVEFVPITRACYERDARTPRPPTSRMTT